MDRRMSGTMVIVLSGIITFLSILMFARFVGGGPVPPDFNVEFWRFIATQSGLLLALLITLWFYRKDFNANINRRDDTLNLFYEAMKEQSEALRQVAVTQAEHTMATNRLSEVVDKMERRIQ